MVQKQMSEMIHSVWRIKWWRYRYMLLAALLVNILAINHFFFDQSVTDLNPFRSPGAVETGAGGTSGSPPTGPTPPTDLTPSKGSTAGKPATELTFNLQDYDFNGEYVGWPLERVCKETDFTPGLVFICDNNTGGIGNIRNFILTCIRYAIEAGASGLIMPRIQQRSEDDLGNLFTSKFHPFDYFFDDAHFRTSLATYCPQITIYEGVEDIPNQEGLVKIPDMSPKNLGDLDGCDGRGANRHLDLWRSDFDGWLAKNNNTPSVEKPRTIRFVWATFFEWPIHRDGPEFAATFGDLLRINPDIAKIASKVLFELARFVKGKEPNPKKFETPFFGVHLRTENDALNYWPDYNTQTEGYLKASGERPHLKHAYLACGNATEARRYADLAWEKQQMNVTNKLDLLKGDDLKQLEELSWDQMALVDFLVLTKSDHFAGCSFSSFAMNLVIKRHLLNDGLKTRQWRSPADKFSTLIGRFQYWYGDWMYMLECLWP